VISLKFLLAGLIVILILLIIMGGVAFVEWMRRP
jgi:hypothetical protein